MVKLQSFHNFAEVPKNVSLGSGMGRHEPDWSGSGQGEFAGSCDYSNEHLGSINCREFLD